jgi:hypothetical protein
MKRIYVEHNLSSGPCSLVPKLWHEGLNLSKLGPEDRVKLLRYAATPYPDIVPVTGIRAVIGNNVELVFRSKVVGRIAVVSQTGVKWY